MNPFLREFLRHADRDRTDLMLASARGGMCTISAHPDLYHMGHASLAMSAGVQCFVWFCMPRSDSCCGDQMHASGAPLV